MAALALVRHCCNNLFWLRVKQKHGIWIARVHWLWISSRGISQLAVAIPEVHHPHLFWFHEQSFHYNISPFTTHVRNVGEFRFHWLQKEILLNVSYAVLSLFATVTWMMAASYCSWIQDQLANQQCHHQSQMKNQTPNMMEWPAAFFFN